MAVELAGDIEREVARYAYAHRPHNRIEHLPVKMQEAFSTRFDEPVVGITTARLPVRRVGDEGATLLQAGQHAGDVFDPLHPAVEGLDEVLLALSSGRRWRRLQDGDVPLVGDVS